MMIRKMQLIDAASISKINQEELGYAYSLKKTQEQLKRLMADSHHYFFVAEDDVTSQIQGYVQLQLYDNLYHDTVLNLMALAVAKNYQGQGVGRALMQKARVLAKELGIAGIRINSGIGRQGAHKFYRQLGCQELSDQKRFYLASQD